MPRPRSGYGLTESPLLGGPELGIRQPTRSELQRLSSFCRGAAQGGVRGHEHRRGIQAIADRTHSGSDLASPLVRLGLPTFKYGVCRPGDRLPGQWRERNVLKVALYAILVACAVIWDAEVDVLNLYDTFSWILAFFVIELNVPGFESGCVIGRHPGEALQPQACILRFPAREELPPHGNIMRIS